MRYTFLLPAYKGRFFEEALRSILNQTYKDFKVIVSDDCSPDDIKSITYKYIEDERIFYRKNEENIGGKSLVAHWNLLVNLCDTDYLIMASDDDIYDKHFLEEVDLLANKYPSVDLIHVRAHLIDKDSNIYSNDALYEEFVSQIDYLDQFNYYNHIECVANQVFKTCALKKIGGFVDFPLAWCSDAATAATIAVNGVVNSSNILFNFRMSGENISSVYNKKDVIWEKYQALNMYDDFMKKIFDEIKLDGTKLQNRTMYQIRNYHKNLIFGTSISCLKVMSFTDFIKYIKEYKHKGYISDNKDYLKLFAKWLLLKFKN